MPRKKAQIGLQFLLGGSGFGGVIEAGEDVGGEDGGHVGGEEDPETARVFLLAIFSFYIAGRDVRGDEQ